MVSWLFLKSRRATSYLNSATFFCFLVTNSFWLLPTLEPEIVRYLLWSGSFQNSSQTLHLVIKVEFENCSLQFYTSSFVHYSILWFYSGSSASGTLSRNHQGSREDLHSAESRDSRISTHANSQSSSVYDNVQKVTSHPRPSSVISSPL